jgi:hypothetical protein
VVVLVAACRDTAPCVPGQQRSCACEGALVGVQVCGTAGTFADCAQCAAMPMMIDAAVDAPVPIDAPMIDAPPDAALAPTGAACTDNSQCTGGNCDTQNLGGTCSAPCSNGAPNTYVDPSCPAAGGYCVNLGTGGQCLALCTDHTGNLACRTGFSCFFFGCLPNTFSQCNPTTAGSCSGGQVCWNMGPDPVGQCRTSCNVFAQGCGPDMGGAAQGCYVVNGLGDQGCVTTGHVADGGTCSNVWDCAPGDQCSGGTCRPFCGGSGNVACAAGTCKLLTGTIGVCVP